MADLMFRKQDYEQAVFHFQQLLERKPGVTGFAFLSKSHPLAFHHLHPVPHQNDANKGVLNETWAPSLNTELCVELVWVCVNVFPMSPLSQTTTQHCPGWLTCYAELANWKRFQGFWRWLKNTRLGPSLSLDTTTAKAFTCGMNTM